MRDVLPPLPPPPVLDPRPGDWNALRVRAARRLRMRYAAGGAALSFAAVVALVVSGPVGGPASLRIQEPAGGGDGGRPGVASAPPGSRESAEPSALGPAPGGGPAPLQVRPETSGGATGPGSRPPAPADPAVPPPAPVRGPGYTRTDVAYASSSEPCDFPAFEGALWCFRLLGDPYRAEAGVAADYRFEVCRLPGSSRQSMTFATTQEFSFGVSGEGGSWAWERDRRFTSPGPTVHVGGGRCARWTLTWAAVDDAGRPLPPGDYTGSVTVHAYYSDAVQHASVNRTFDVEVTG